MTTTKNEILATIKELEEAMLENIDISNKEVNIKFLKIKSHKRLSMARDEVRALSLN